MININEQSMVLVNKMTDHADALGIHCTTLGNGAKVIDAGVKVEAGLEAGRLFSEICLGSLGQVQLTRLNFNNIYLPGVSVSVAHPAIACMGSQYAGWALKVKAPKKEDNYFAMASGPGRALYAKEPLFKQINYTDASDVAVLALESRTLPNEQVARLVAEKCKVQEDRVCLVVAPTASLAGSVQVGARVVETGMHKMHELGFDINTIVSGFGTCPLAAIAKNDIKAIGRTNDTVLYAGQAWYTVKTEDKAIEAVIEQLPSSSSKDYGTSFYELFKRYDKDFYKIDPLLFSPAQVTINNITSGHSFTAGNIDPDLIQGIILEK